MIRATVTSTVDQALLSALNFGLAFLLIHFASKQDYGLYSQLINLQSFFSPFHAGIFVSAYLALASKMDGSRLVAFRHSMAQAEVVMTIFSSMLIVAVFLIGSKVLDSHLSVNICLAFACALLGLWWREFIRQTRFVELRYDHALHIDAIYCVATCLALGPIVALNKLTTGAVFWCMAFGAIIAAGLPLSALVRGTSFNATAIKSDVSLSWNVGRWEVIGSVVTWGYAQSYIYFAALHGGLDEAAETSAGRLLAMPLALLWASYANVMRPNVSKMLTRGSFEGAQQLATRSALLVVAVSVIYASIMFVVIPMLAPTLFGGKFPLLKSISMWWILYFALTGVSTVGASMLRCALQFRQVFHLQVVNCVIAISLLTVSLRFPTAESLVVALVIIESISALLFWRSAKAAVALDQNAGLLE
jgi:O-antigen/teichoic acid export membrane protein